MPHKSKPKRGERAKTNKKTRKTKKTKHSIAEKVEAEYSTINKGSIDFYNGDELAHSLPLYSPSALEYIREVE